MTTTPRAAAPPGERVGPPPPRRAAPSNGSLATRVLVAQLALLLVALVPLGVAAVQQTRQAERQRAVDVALAVTSSLADMPWLVDAVTGPDPAGVLRDPVERIRADAGVDFVVVMATDGTRFTHPNPEEVGGTFIGTIAGAQAGQITIEDAHGTLGPSVRVVAPVHDADGEIVALVSTGVVLREVSHRVRSTVVRTLAIGAVGLGLAVLAAGWLSRTVRRQTFGLGALGLARMHSYQDALIGSVQSGLVLMANDATVVVVNDEARELLDLPALPPGTPAAALTDHGVDPELAELLASGRTTDAEMFTAQGRTLVVTQVDALSEGRRLGWVSVIADRTELARASGELDNLRVFTESLRARSHEADNRLHTVAMLVELGEYEEAIEFATASSRSSQALTDEVVGKVADSALAALVLGKSAQGAERGVALTVTALDVPAGRFDAGELVTIVGNLLDNALDAAGAGAVPRAVVLCARVEDDALVIRVCDSGPGVPPELQSRIFERGFSTKPSSPQRPHGRGIGLSLVAQTVRRHGGTITVSRRGPGTGTEALADERDGATADGVAARATAEPGCGPTGTADLTCFEARLPLPEGPSSTADEPDTVEEQR